MQDSLSLLDPSRLLEMTLSIAPNVLAGVLVVLVFWVLVRLTAPALRQILERANFAKPLIALLVDNVYRFAILTVGLVMAASQLGIDVAAALAGIGVVGIAVGFAAQETIANMIAGFLIFWDRPFEVGHWVTTAQGKYGEVRNITMRTTRIRTLENTFVVLPNKQIIGDMLVNHSMYGRMRLNVPVGIAYKEDIREARRVILEALSELDLVMKNPAPDVVATELGNSSVNLLVRVWMSDAKDERAVHFATIEACKLALDAAGIQIPFPHLQLFVDDVRPNVWQGWQRARSGALGDSADAN